MKFSKKKKANMRKIRQRRINRCCKDMIGCCIDYEAGYVVIDQAKIGGIKYLLVETQDDQYAIYKIVRIGEYVRLSPKKVLHNKKTFSNHDYWNEHSTIEINEDGAIKSVKLGSIFGPYNRKNGRFNTYVAIYFDFA